jgi:predicted DNA-binding protein (MmcQ/YjbR family)
MTAAEVDPLQSEAGRTLLRMLRKICLAYPESEEGTQFGSPVWRAGRKAFAVARADGGRVAAGFWVGVERQQLMLADPRLRIPPYTGHNGWIELDATGGCDAAELAGLADGSYRHFALRRMLRVLRQAPASG